MRPIAALALAAAFALSLPAQRGPRGRFSDTRSDALPAAASDAERRILSVLEKARQSGELFQNVPVSDGRLLRVLVETSGAKNVVEIGTSTGLSGLWLCLGLQKTGGRLTTFEYDAGRAATARRHFEAAGVDHIATIVQGDAHQTISRVTGPLDVVFIDADKEGYVDYFKRLLPLVRPGGLILAHNYEMAPDYMQLVSSDPALETIVYSQGGGLALTMKKR